MDGVLAARKAATESLLVNLELARLAAIQHLFPASERCSHQTDAV
jgi:hypothetical protein